MLFDNITIRLPGSDDFPAQARQQAAADLTTATREGALAIPIAAPLASKPPPKPTTWSTPAAESESCCASQTDLRRVLSPRQPPGEREPV
jgi:hypothetical protein